MKKENTRSAPNSQNQVRWIFGGLVLVTIYFQTNLADPFNSPKSWLLLLIASWLTGHIWAHRRLIQNFSPLKTLLTLCAVFIVSALIATLFSNFLYTAIFGEVQRRNGLLSYLSLVTLMFASAMFMRLSNIEILYKSTYFIAVLTTIYAFMQTTGNDFVNWNNPYNPVITTLGNPNFAAALMAVIGVLVFSAIWTPTLKSYFRIAGLPLSLLLLVAIYRSNARQGLLAYLVGVGLFLIILLWIKNSWIGLGATIIGSSLVVTAIFGMLQIGPFSALLYKGSVTVRGYYWQAGFEMLKNYPLTGVGMDRYGAFFKQFRESKYPLSYGFELTSNNAHNTFIQFFATGGIPLGISYLLLNLYIALKAFNALRLSPDTKKLIIAGVLSAWVAFHTQSLVSIDNVGLSIWGWILGGSLIGLSISTQINHSNTNHIEKRPKQINVSGALISGSFTVIAIIIVSMLYRVENLSFQASGVYSLQTAQERNTYRDANLKLYNSTLIDPMSKLQVAINLIQSGYVNEGLNILRDILQKDPRNLDALNSMAQLFEQSKNYTDAIEARKKIIELDPWNASNYLSLGLIFKSLGDYKGSQQMLLKILSFASSHPISDQAKIELAP